MTRESLDVFIKLREVICHDEGDGWGDAEPYLWTAFFRIGGDDVTIVLDGVDFSATPPKPIIHLEGSPLMQFGLGSHGNLGTDDVDEGEIVPIPGFIGLYGTLLKPIPIPQALKDLGEAAGVEVPDDLPGYVGAIVVLMEEDNVTDDGAEAGHSGLNNAIREALQAVIDTRSYDNSGVSDADIESLTKGIDDKVEDAIRAQQNLFEDIWSYLNKDDEIGHQVFIFTTDDLVGQTSLPIQQRWENEGDWEIRGDVIPTPVCPADAFAEILDRLFGPSKKVRYDRQALQHFRDHEFLRYHNIRPWFELIRQNKGSVASLMLRDRKVNRLVLDLFHSAQELVKKPEGKISDADIDRGLALLEVLRKEGDRHLRIGASRAAFVAEKCRGKTVREALAILNEFSPVRHQRQSKDLPE